jgi:hypothetical protein
MRAALLLLLAGCAGPSALVIRVEGMQRGPGGKT